NVGTLCVMDVQPHALTNEQLHSLKALSRQVTHIMELKLSIEHLEKSVHHIEQKNIALRKIAQVQSHDIREPLTSIMGVVNQMKEEEATSQNEYFPYLQTAVKRLDEKIRSIVNLSSNARLMN